METYSVKVYGSEHSIRADRDGQHVSEIARVVDDKMKEIDHQFRPGSTSRTAVLACMTLVDEHLQDRQRNVDWVRLRVGRLIDKLDSVT